MNKRWLLSKDGQDFMRTVASQINALQTPRLAAKTFVSGGVDDDWTATKNAYFFGLAAVFGRNLTAQERAPFDAKIEEIYNARYYDGYDTVPDVGIVVAQAQTMGNLTVYMYKLNRGDVGRYPSPDPSLTVPAVYHLEWARDFVGFWVLGKNRWEIPLNPDTRQASPTLGQEFDDGCSLC